jgi:hypothetical protein
VHHQATAHALEPDIVSRLARFFPEAAPVRIPIRLSRATGNNNNHAGGNDDASDSENSSVFIQETVIEFGTPHEALFALDRPLEFADHVIVESKDKDSALHAEASVVAVQYHPERTVVAVRFLKNVPHWIVKS